jgi:hypothetical protein
MMNKVKIKAETKQKTKLKTEKCIKLERDFKQVFYQEAYYMEPNYKPKTD